MPSKKAKKRRGATRRSQKQKQSLRNLSADIVVFRAQHTPTTPLDRLYRAGSINSEQHIAGQYFAECAESARTGPAAPAQNLERGGSGGVARPQQERLRSVLEMIRDYRLGLGAMDRSDHESGAPVGTTRLIVVAVAVSRISLDDIDARAGRRKGWAKTTLIRGLNALWGEWHRLIANQSKG